MTEFCAESGRRKASLMHPVFVQMIVLLIGVSVGSGAAEAKILDEFLRRCLVPMEGVQFPKVDDLTRSSRKLESDGLHYEDRFIVEENGYAMFIVKHVIASGEAVSCGVEIQFGDQMDALISEFAATMSVRRSVGAFLIDDRWFGDSGASFLSTDWREPKLSVGAFQNSFGWVSFWASETDLES